MVRGIPWARPSNVLTEPAGTAASAPGHADKKRRSTLHSGAAAAVEAAGGAQGIVQPGKGKILVIVQIILVSISVHQDIIFSLTIIKFYVFFGC